MIPALHTEREVAALLRRSERFVRAERARGRIAYVPIGRTIYYSDEHVAEYIASRTVPRRALPRPVRAGVLR